MAEKKVQSYLGKDVVIEQNPGNNMFYINTYMSDEDKAKVPQPPLGLAKFAGFEGPGFKTEADAQYQIDNQPEIPEDSPAYPGTASSKQGATGTFSGPVGGSGNSTLPEA